MTISANIIYEGSLVDICDSIVSVSGFSRAFSGELIRFKSSVVEIYGFVLNLEYSVCKIPLISGSQTSLSIGDLVCSTKKPRYWRVMPSNHARSCFRIGLRRYSTAPKPPLFGTVTGSGSDVVLNRTTLDRFSKQPLFQLFMQWYSIKKQIPMNEINVAAPLSSNNVTEHHITQNTSTSDKQNAGEDNAHSG